jgi:endonuclease/exonuclease/phosphatase family metal-dependent hydrolase
VFVHACAFVRGKRVLSSLLALEKQSKMDYIEHMNAKKKSALIGGLKKMLLILASVIALLVLCFVIFYAWASSGSLPKNKLSEIVTFSNVREEKPEKMDTTTYTVMSYNIGYLSGMTNNLAVTREKLLFEKNMTTFLDLLSKSKPDILAFQEIDFNSKRSYYINQFHTIAEKAGYTYGAAAVNWDKKYVPFPYWPPSIHFGKMLSGQGVLSGRPILSTERIVLQKRKDKPFYYNAFYLDRLVQVTKIKIDNKELIILNLHLEAMDRETREEQAQTVLDIYNSYKNDYPVLLLGDFNSVPPSAEQKMNFIDEPETDFTGDKTITLFLQEESLKVAELSVFTFPSDKPTRKLDYIFYNHDKIHMIKAFTADIDSSDHLPLVMEFSFVGEK